MGWDPGFQEILPSSPALALGRRALLPSAGHCGDWGRTVAGGSPGRLTVALPVQVFDELLLDADFSVNAGSWMWLSCSAFFQQFFHCYCPVGFGRRTDPSGDYIR